MQILFITTVYIYISNWFPLLPPIFFLLLLFLFFFHFFCTFLVSRFKRSDIVIEDGRVLHPTITWLDRYLVLRLTHERPR